MDYNWKYYEKKTRLNLNTAKAGHRMQVQTENKTVWNDSYNIEGNTFFPIYQQAKIKLFMFDKAWSKKAEFCQCPAINFDPKCTADSY